MKFLLIKAGLFISALAILAAPVPASAQDAEGQTTTAPAALENPYQDKLRAVALQLSGDLKQEELNRLNQLRQVFGMARAVKLVQGDVEEAVMSCGEKNEELKTGLDERFLTWDKAVSGEVTKIDHKIEQVLDSGMFTHPNKIREYFMITDQAANFVAEQMDERIITTKEACKRLLDSMSQTQEKLVSSLHSVSFPTMDAPENKGPETGMTQPAESAPVKASADSEAPDADKVEESSE